jgi:hypothetical protein
MDPRTRSCLLVCLTLLACLRPALAENLHFSYLWHLEQPIYWPDQQVPAPDRYESAWQSILRTDAGAVHPANNLRDIFSLPDRVAAYQYRVRDSINSIQWAAEAGAQVSYSGGLIENIASLGAVNQLGYTPTWFSSLRQARGWQTVGQSRPRCDIVVFPFHHPLLPLCDASAVRKEIQLYKAVYASAWGTAVPMSKGLFPPEMAFSTRLIPILADEDIDWVFVSGEHLSRSCTDFPVILGSGGINCDPPNAADQINPAQTNYYRRTISRGCSPAEAAPFAFTPHRAQYVDPDTGTVSQVTIVPCSQSLGWDDGYAPLGLGGFNALQPFNDPARPMLVVLAHDGDNAWGGGYSYYVEATPNLVSQAQSAGYTATVVEEYLADHPVPAGDIVHIEDGAWVNADGDFGSPIMLNWNWPLVSATGLIDIAAGWAEDERNWAVITAAQNRVDTAEQIAGGCEINQILSPGPSATPAERAWHYFLASLNSGYMYYGTSLDMEVKPTIACNEAVEHANAVIGDGASDATPPTIWLPQRHPWNPGGLNFGPQYGYQQHAAGTAFWIWTFVYDVSGLASVSLKYRIDADGLNPLNSTHNETYAGGAEVGPWQSIPMTQRPFPAGNVHNNPSIDFFEMPAYIADEYYTQLSGLSDVLIDYYVEAADNHGHVRRGPIQHVFIGDGGGVTPGDTVQLDPTPPVAGQTVTVRYNPAGRPLQNAAQVHIHYGFNNWNPVISPDPPMAWNAAEAVWQATLNLPASANQIDMVFNNGAGLWDNNNGQDWHFPVTGGTSSPAWIMDGQRDADATLVSANGGMSLYAGVRNGVLYVATPDAGEGNDHFIFIAGAPGALRAAPWAKAGQVADWSAFLADENDNNFAAWFDASPAAGPQSATPASNGGWLEGTIDLAAELGALPDSIQLAVGPYATPNAGALTASAQVPPSINGNGTLDAAEYVVMNTFRLGDCNADWRIDSADIPIFVNVLLGADADQDHLRAADVNANQFTDGADIPAFVALLTAS